MYVQANTAVVERSAGTATTRRSARFVALDQVRGLAIVCMVMAHFGPGLYERLGIVGPARDGLDFIGRLATPAFVLIFGITLAFIYVPKATVLPAATRRGLIKRAGLVLLCSLIVSLHGTVNALLSNAPNLWFRLILAQYSVLTFYTVAIFATALVIPRIARDPLRIGVLGGALLVFVGSVLGYDAFPAQGSNALELVRLLFVSGKYGVFVLMGCAWMMIAVGLLIRRHREQGTSFHQDVLTIALGLALLGLSDGRIVGWGTIGDLAHHYGDPPQFWYLAMVGGAMLVALVALDRYRLPVVGFVLERIGRFPLSVYVAHSLVLPGVALLRYLVPALPEVVGVLSCLLLFVLFCSYKVWASVASDRVRRDAAAARALLPA